MRLSEQSRVSARLGYLDAAQQRLDRVQMQLSTGRRISRASDDPGGTVLALQHREDIDFEAQMRRNLSSGVAFLNASEAALGGASEVLQRVRELTIQAANDTLGGSERANIAAEVNQLISHLAQLGNTSFGGAYIFSGHESKTPAYAVTGNPPTAVTFQGDTGLRTRRISEQDAVPINVAGSNVFGSVFSDLISLRDDLVGSATGTAIAAHVATIDSALDRTLAARADLGARTNRLDAATRLSEQADINLQGLRAGIEEIDFTATVTRFAAEQTAYQAALGAIGRTANMSLLDYLR